MIVTIDQALHTRNVTRYWLSQQINCNYQSLCKLCSNQTTSISFDMVQKICTTLKCTPNEIFKLE